jgi:hypothetical protein
VGMRGVPIFGDWLEEKEKAGEGKPVLVTD